MAATRLFHRLFFLSFVLLLGWAPPAGAKAVYLSPSPGSTLTGSTVTFSFYWDTTVDHWSIAVRNAQGTTLGTDGRYEAVSPYQSRSVTAYNVPQDGSQVTVLLYTLYRGDSSYTYNTFTYSTRSATSTATSADIYSPPDGSVLASSAVTFYWPNVGASYYYLYVGNSPGAADVTYRGSGSPSVYVSGLPVDGRTLYVTLKGRWDTRDQFGQTILGQWQELDRNYYFAYTAAPKAAISSPASNSTFASGTVTFQWGPAGASEFWLKVGTQYNGSDLHSASQQTNLSRTLSGLPTNGIPIHVALGSRIGGAWQWNYTQYRAFTSTALPRAIMANPPNGSTLSSGAATFEWIDTGASEYWLAIGSSSGGTDLYSGSQGIATSRTVTGLPTDGRTLHVKLGTRIDGWFQYEYYQYTAYRVPIDPAVIASPASGSTLASTSATFSWNPTGATAYYLGLGSSYGAVDLYSGNEGTNTSRSVSNLPSDGRTIHVRLGSLIYGTWQYTYSSLVAYTAPAIQKAVLTGPANGSTFASTTVTFQWTSTGAADYRLHLGNVQGGTDLGVFVVQGTWYTVSGLPSDGRRIWVDLGTRVSSSSYQFESYSFYAYRTSVLPGEITNPTPGSTLSSSVVTFTWKHQGASDYYLYVGSTAGGSDVYAGYQGQATSATVQNIPADGRPIHVRLWSLISGSWQFRDYQYTAAGSSTSTSTPRAAAITSPANGSSIYGYSVTFAWENVGAAEYYLYVGTGGVGSYDLYLGSQGLATSRLVSNFPGGGRRIYVRLWTRHSSTGWLYQDFQYVSW